MPHEESYPTLSSRREFIGIAAALAGTGILHGEQAPGAIKNIIGVDLTQLIRSYGEDLVANNLAYQKGIKGDRVAGRLDAKAINTHLLESYKQINNAAYNSVVERFTSMDINAVDPAGGMRAIGREEKRLLSLLEPPPTLGSKRNGNELIELMWAARLRDVAFVDYSQDAQCHAAANELFALGLMPDNNPRHLFGYEVNSRFRGHELSAFLACPLREWPDVRPQAYPRLTDKVDYLADIAGWRVAQSGTVRSLRFKDLTVSRGAIRTARDLASLVYRDYPTQLYLSACVMLEDFRDRVWSRDRPFRQQDACASFLCGGFAHLLSLVSLVTQYALELCWFAKWGVFLYPRPEELVVWCGFGKNNPTLDGLRKQLLESQVAHQLSEEMRNNEIPLLSTAYPEGAPTHPSFPSGHAVVAGAAIAAIKAFLRADATISDPSGNHAIPLNVSEQLDLLAWNMSFGRCFAGIHYRSDCLNGIQWGEEIAISFMRTHFGMLIPEFDTTIKRFNGSHQRIANR